MTKKTQRIKERIEGRESCFNNRKMRCGKEKLK